MNLENKNYSQKSPIFRLLKLFLLAVSLFLSFLAFVSIALNWVVTWDEGWNFEVASNLAESGRFIRMKAGEEMAANLHNGFITVASIAASFKAFGVGVFQARLPAILYAVFSLIFLWRLAFHLLGSSVSTYLLLVLFMLALKPSSSIFYVGAQGVAESQLLFFICSGLLILLSALKKNSVVLSLLAAGLFSFAVTSKYQCFPFLLFSLFISSVVCFFYRDKKSALLFFITFIALLIGQLGAFFLLHQVSSLFSPAHLAGSAEAVSGVFSVHAFVLDLGVRKNILFYSLKVFYLAFISLLLSSVFILKAFFRISPEGDRDVKETYLFFFLLLVSSWFAWYLFFSIGWDRYIVPPLTLCSILALYVFKKLCERFRASSQVFFSCSLLLLLTLCGSSLYKHSGAIRHLWKYPVIKQYYDALAWLNAEQGDILVETYESAAFFLLDKDYHYPPDELHVQLNRKKFLLQDRKLVVDYDPTHKSPDYILLGLSGRMWGLYGEPIANNNFRRVFSNLNYEIYATDF